jgi:hypothetical protein
MDMKNETTSMNLSDLAATATLGELALADTQGKLKLTKLPAAQPKRSQLVFTSGHRSTGYRASGVKVRGGSGCNASVPAAQWHHGA